MVCHAERAAYAKAQKQEGPRPSNAWHQKEFRENGGPQLNSAIAERTGSLQSCHPPKGQGPGGCSSPGGHMPQHFCTVLS
jgi:hypothetical protein